MPDAIAIDFGTSRTKVAYWDERTHSPRLVRLGYGDEPFVPSLFYLPRASEEILWGCDAEEMLQEEPAGIVEVLKRHLQDSYVFANHRKVSPQELLTLMFSRLREQVGQEVLALQGALPAKAVLTLPALYGPAVEKRLREAAQAAAFNEVELVPEPVAAARAWLVETGETGRSVVVLDCGGGTLDLAYLGYEHGQFRIVPECPPGGDTHVGGYDVDRELLNLLREQVPEAVEELEQRQPFYLNQVRVLKERYCRGLPLRPLRVAGQRLDLNVQDIQAVLTDRFIAQTSESLKAYLGRVVSLTGEETPPVLLVGGSARIKGLKEALEEHCGCQALWWERSEFATVLGAVPLSAEDRSALQQNRMTVETAGNDHELKQTETEKLGTRAEQQGQREEQVTAIEQEARGDTEEACVKPQTTLASYEPSSEAQKLMNEAEQLQKRGQLDTALQYIQAACELDPHWDALFLAKTIFLHEKGEYRLATPVASVCLRINPNATLAYFLRGKCKFMMKEYADAIQDFDKAISLKSEAQYYELRGIANAAVGNNRAAVGDIQAALQNPGGCTLPLAALHAAAGYLLHKMLDSPNESLAAFESALAALPGNPDVEFNAKFQEGCKHYGFEVQQEGADIAVERCLWNASKEIYGCSRRAAEMFRNCHKRPSISIGDGDPDFAFFMASISAQYPKDAKGTIQHWLERLFAANPDFDMEAIRKDPWIQQCANPALRMFLTPTFSWTKTSGSVFNSLTINNTSAFRVSSVNVTVVVNRNDIPSQDVINKHLKTLRAGESYRSFLYGAGSGL